MRRSFVLFSKYFRFESSLLLFDWNESVKTYIKIALLMFLPRIALLNRCFLTRMIIFNDWIISIVDGIGNLTQINRDTTLLQNATRILSVRSIRWSLVDYYLCK